MTKYILYVDGSYNPHTIHYGGSYYIIAFNDQHQHIPQQTFSGVFQGNAEAFLKSRQIPGECGAALLAMQEVSKMCKKSDTIEIRYDFLGVEYWVTGEWKKKKPTSISYSNKALQIIKKLPPIEFTHIDGHTGEIGNEYVDKLAKYAVGVRKTLPDEPKYYEIKYKL